MCILLFLGEIKNKEVEILNWHALPIEEVLKKLNTNKERGLNETTVSQRLIQYGKNKLRESKRKSLFARFFSQFKDFMTIILLIASVISFVAAIIENKGEFLDPIIILFIVVMNAIIGTLEETKAEKAIMALKELSAPRCNVIRNGISKLIFSENLVPGDILVLSSGDLVSADCRLIETNDFATKESSLTGESSAVKKNANLVLKQNLSIGDLKNVALSSSVVVSGHAKGVVVSTGMNTEIGKIANLINDSENPKTPLQKKLEKTSKILGGIVIAVSLIVFLLGIIQKINLLEMLMVSISLAVAAIPEGLIAVVSIILAIGVRKMSMHRAIIRKLPAVETLGSATVICSDKTGTLTQNKMTVSEITDGIKKLSLGNKTYEEILSLATLCSNAKLDERTKKISTGTPTEGAIVECFGKIPNKSQSELFNKYPRVKEIPFDSTKKIMTTINKIKNGKYRVITKGAPDVVLKMCNTYKGRILTSNLKEEITKKNIEMANRALRVIAVAFKDIESVNESKDVLLENDLNFCGLIGMIDPPRPEAKISVNECKNAGIKPVMITGDYIITAKSIAKELGIFDEEKDKAITGPELEKMSDENLEKEIFKYSVFARVSPEHKVRIVRAFQKNDAVVAMTGDGVNDAPALKAADIGCAMGKSGTEVAKSASDMILTDDNFNTIVEAIRRGRGVFENIKRTVHFLISSNVGELVTILTAFALGLPTPLLAIQLLWVNLITDSFPALALGVEPIDKNIMNRPARKKIKGLFSKNEWVNVILEGSFIGIISMLAFTIGRNFFDFSSFNPVIGRTMAFAVSSLSQVMHSINLRSEKSIFKIKMFSNSKMVFSVVLCIILQMFAISIPVFNTVFRTKCLNFMQWAIVAILAVSPIILVEIEKLFGKFDLRDN